MHTDEAAVKSRRAMYSEATREALLDAATEQFVTRGFAATALADVAAAAHATRGAVYHHFADKSALYEAVMDRFGTAAVETITAAAARGSDPWDAAMRALDTFLELCCEPRYARIVWQEGPAALGWERWRACEQEHGLGLTRELVRVLMDQGFLEPAPLETLTRIVFAMIGEAGMTVAEAGGGKAQQRVRRECSQLLRRFMEGMRADHG